MESISLKIKNYKLKVSPGFTLIELLITIAIIGSMVAFVTFTFRNPQRRGRDTRRISDLKQFMTALEVYASRHNGSYPVSATANAANLCTLAILGTTSCPTDPTNNAINGYQYTYQSNGSQYVLWVRQEASTVTNGSNIVFCSDGRSGRANITGFSVTNGACPSITLF